MIRKNAKKNLAFDFDDVICETTRAFLAFNKKIYNIAVPYAVAKDLLILKKDYRLILISARDQRWQFQVKTWIKRYLPNIFAEIIFIDNGQSSTTRQNKGQACRQNQALALVEDEPQYMKSCLSLKIPVIVFARPWNKNFKTKLPRIKKLSQLHKVLGCFEN